MAEVPERTFLLLAQLPPPVHGVTVMTERFRGVVEAQGGWSIEHLWLGGSKGLADINRRSFTKYLGFASLLLKLLVRRVTGPRADVAYVTLAPWTHAALRDVLLAGAAKGVSARTLVHLHGEGLDKLLQGSSLKARLCRRMLRCTELIACTSAAAEIAEKAELFVRTDVLANVAPDPGPVPPLVTEQIVRIGYLANLDPRKGVVRFIDGIAEARATGITLSAKIAGPSTPFLTREEVEALIDERGLRGIITVQDGLYGADKDAFLRGLDVLLYPSIHDHAPLVVIEALSYGVAPIVMDTGGVREMLGKSLAQNVFDPQAGLEKFGRFVASRLSVYALEGASLSADRAAARARYEERYTEARFTARCIDMLYAPSTAKRGKEL